MAKKTKNVSVWDIIIKQSPAKIAEIDAKLKDAMIRYDKIDDEIQMLREHKVAISQMFTSAKFMKRIGADLSDQD